MKNLWVFLGILLVSLAVSVVQSGPMPAQSEEDDSPTKDAKPKDWFENIIKETLDMSVRDLFLLTQRTFNDLNSVTESGMSEMKKIGDEASSEVQLELRKVEEQVTKKIFEIAGKLLIDLGNVLPSLTGIRPESEEEGKKEEISPYSAADIIWAILGITLENFVISIENAFDGCSELLWSLVEEFRALAEVASPEVAQALRYISDEYLLHGLQVVTPVLHKFQQLV